MAEVFHASLRG